GVVAGNGLKAVSCRRSMTTSGIQLLERKLRVGQEWRRQCFSRVETKGPLRRISSIPSVYTHDVAIRVDDPSIRGRPCADRHRASSAHLSIACSVKEFPPPGPVNLADSSTS